MVGIMIYISTSPKALHLSSSLFALFALYRKRKIKIFQDKLHLTLHSHLEEVKGICQLSLSKA